MIAEPGSIGAANQLLQAAQMLRIRRGHRAEVHGDAVLHNAILLEDLVEDGQARPGIDHEIFSDDFEPVDHRLARKDVLIVRNAKADSDAVIRNALKRLPDMEGSDQ